MDDSMPDHEHVVRVWVRFRFSGIFSQDLKIGTRREAEGLMGSEVDKGWGVNG